MLCFHHARYAPSAATRREVKEKCVHLFGVGHVNAAMKLGVKAGLEYGRGNSDARCLTCTVIRLV